MLHTTTGAKDRHYRPFIFYLYRACRNRQWRKKLASIDPLLSAQKTCEAICSVYQSATKTNHGITIAPFCWIEVACWEGKTVVREMVNHEDSVLELLPCRTYYIDGMRIRTPRSLLLSRLTTSVVDGIVTYFRSPESAAVDSTHEP